MHYLDGNYNEQQSQRHLLEDKGFYVANPENEPAIDSTRYRDALEVIWKSKAPGWANYFEDLITMGICTADEVLAVLDK